MSVVNEKANLVAGEIAEKVTRDVAFDVLTILAIGQIVIAVVKLFLVCMEKPGAARRVMGRPNFLQRYRLRRIVRDALKDHPNKAALVAALPEALQKIGTTLTTEEVEKMFEEVK